ncbi:MAG: hypothetical protein KOO62_03635 [candidate division Zixibacteria bacterium]|nr:hypothetical protein [candidate division Zixibacteria bacterium]
MTEQVERKGMSKGCLVALIIAGVLVVLVAIAGVTCYMNRDALARYGAVTMISGVRTMIAENPADGVDTIAVFAVTDAFIEKLQADEEIATEEVGLFMQSLQPLVSDENIDADEVDEYIEMLVGLYPELGDMVLETQEVVQPDSGLVPDDSIATE